MRYQISGTVHVKDQNQGMVLLKDLEKDLKKVLVKDLVKDLAEHLVKDLEKDQRRGLPKLLQKNILRGQLVDVLKDSQRRLVNLAAQQAAI